MKLAVNTYSYANARSEDGTPLSQLQMIEAAAKTGFDAVEVVGLLCGEGEDPIAYAKRLAEKAAACGIPIIGYTTAADLLRDGEVERLKGEVDIAAALGASYMRHDAAWNAPEGKTFEDVLPILAEKAKAVTAYAKERGIRTTIENHGHFVQGGARMVALVKAIGDPNFGLLCDVGNFMCADEISTEAVKAVAPYAIYVHAKDFHYKSKEEVETPPAGYFPTRGGNYLCGAAIGDGVVDVKTCLSILKDAGYDGFVSLEFEGPGDVLAEIRKGYGRLRDYMA